MDKKRHPSPAFLAWARLLRAHQHLMEAVQADLASAGHPPLEWYDVLLELDLAPEGRLRLFELGERMALSRSNLTRLCDRLEKELLLQREQCADDRRGLYAVITPSGRELRKRMWPVYRRAVEQHFAAPLTEDEIHLLATLMQKLRSAESQAE